MHLIRTGHVITEEDGTKAQVIHVVPTNENGFYFNGPWRAIMPQLQKWEGVPQGWMDALNKIQKQFGTSTYIRKGQVRDSFSHVDILPAQGISRPTAVISSAYLALKEMTLDAADWTPYLQLVGNVIDFRAYREDEEATVSRFGIAHFEPRKKNSEKD